LALQTFSHSVSNSAGGKFGAVYDFSMNSRKENLRMKTYGWVLACLLSVPMPALATASCRPKDNRPLIIGHTYKLDGFTTFRMKNSARLLGYKVKFLDMRKANSPVEGLQQVDGFIVPGGADINPRYYAKETLPPEVLATIEEFRSYFNPSSEGDARDPYEYEVYQQYYSSPQFATLPVLGICRGMQMMAVAKGIPLLQDVKAELGIRNRYNRFDRFRVSDTTGVMGAIFPSGTALGFKFHHQNPRLDYMLAYPERHPDVKVTATSWTGRIMEAMELTDRPALGVQFHPEKSFPSVKHRVFKWLLTEACERTHHGDSK
jgi:putative glutamine amidotransferase